MTASKVSMTAQQSGAIQVAALLATAAASTDLCASRSHQTGRINSSPSTECQCLLSTVSEMLVSFVITHFDTILIFAENGYSGNPGWNGNNGGNKPLNQNMLTRTWTDASGVHRKSPSMWNDDSKSMNGVFILKQRNSRFLFNLMYLFISLGSMTPNNWSDGQIDTSNWGSSKPAKPLTREMILSSKQYRLLIDLGHKVSVFCHIMPIDVTSTLTNFLIC